MCMCVNIHAYTPTYTPTRVKNRKTQDNTPMTPSVKNNPPHQVTSALHRLVEPPNLVLQREWSNCEHTSAFAHPAVIVSQIYTMMSKTPVECDTPAITDAQDTCLVHTALTTKMHIHPRPQCDRAAMPSPCKALRPIMHLELCPRNHQIPQSPLSQPQLRWQRGIFWSYALVRGPSWHFVWHWNIKQSTNFTNRTIQLLFGWESWKYYFCPFINLRGTAACVTEWLVSLCGARPWWHEGLVSYIEHA